MHLRPEPGDPLLAGLLFAPVFFALGIVVYQVYYLSFERKGESPLRGLVFFFGLLFKKGRGK